MRGTIRLFQVAGIDLKLHFTFPLILILGALQWGREHGTRGMVFGVLLTVALFACVTLHELGHSVVARGFGIPVREIVLMPIGGVALFTRMPRKPLQELLIAVAGPAVNVVIAALLTTALLAWQGALPFSTAGLTAAQLTNPSLLTFLHWLLIANVSLVLFNLIPAFPMDGGRMLRAVLAWLLGFRQATRIASLIGQGLAAVAGIWALFANQILLAVLALFVFLGAGRELAVEEARHLLSSRRIGDVYNKYALVLAPGDRASRVVDFILTSYQPDFAVIQGAQLLGVVRRESLLAAMAADPSDPYVAGIMNRNVLRLPADTQLDGAQEQMADAGADIAAVMEGDRFLGLVSLEDLREVLQISAVLDRGSRAASA
ncbi:MAG TPA: site-2 protease family protein [Thermoanaerobaculia bacterium]|nr:site-2 protease family protein [Thermoanaerobaculia bacterium]